MNRVEATSGLHVKFNDSSDHKFPEEFVIDVIHEQHIDEPLFVATLSSTITAHKVQITSWDEVDVVPEKVVDSTIQNLTPPSELMNEAGRVMMEAVTTPNYISRGLGTHINADDIDLILQTIDRGLEFSSDPTYQDKAAQIKQLLNPQFNLPRRLNKSIADILAHHFPGFESGVYHQFWNNLIEESEKQC